MHANLHLWKCGYLRSREQNPAQLSVESLRRARALEGGCSRGTIYRLAFLRSGHKLVLQHAATDGSWYRLLSAKERCPQFATGELWSANLPGSPEPAIWLHPRPEEFRM